MGSGKSGQLGGMKKLSATLRGSILLEGDWTSEHPPRRVVAVLDLIQQQEERMKGEKTKLTYYGVAELAIVVSNLRRSRQFYIDVVGFEPTEIDVGERACILKISDKHYLGLWEPGVWKSDYLSPERNASYFGNQLGPVHPVFAIDQRDMPILAQRLQDAGYRTDGPMPHSDGALHLYVSDPDNHAIEFWGWTVV